jgi:hypothetical protein
VEINKARDNRWSKRIKKEFYGICYLCGKKGSDPHHIFERGILELRYLVFNGVYVCTKHHRHLENISEEEYKEIMYRLIGEYTYEEFDKIRKGLRKNNGEFEEVK